MLRRSLHFGMIRVTLYYYSTQLHYPFVVQKYGYMASLDFPRVLYGSEDGLADATGSATPDAEWRQACGDSPARFEFRARAPFHPLHFLCFICQRWPGSIRWHGTFWLDNAPDYRFELAIFAGSSRYRPVGVWRAVCSDGGPARPDAGASADGRTWHRKYGDRFQYLVAYGDPVDESHLDSQLRACLVTPEHHSPGVRALGDLTSNRLA